MRTFRVFFLVGLIMSLVICGCGGSGPNDARFRPTIQDIEAVNKAVSPTIALVMVKKPATALGGRLAELFMTTLVETIRGENEKVHLLSPQDKGYPGFLIEAAAGTTGEDTGRLAEAARFQGVQGVLVVSLSDFIPDNRKSGFWFFRKIKHYMNFNVVFDLYDPLSGAKWISDVREQTTRISDDDYESLQYGGEMDIEDLSESITDIAEDFGETIAEAVGGHPWKTTVTGRDGQRIFIAATPHSGLRTGDRLAVFEGRRVMTGGRGGQFIVPGYKLGEVRVTAVGESVCETVAEEEAQDAGGIKVGDIAVAIK